MKTEEKTTITVTAIVSLPVEKVWRYWITPEDIVRWNNASDDWHTPRANNDLRAGGKFNYRMEARDGSMGFDFGGVYDKVILNKQIDYSMGDGRKVKIVFKARDNRTEIIESFEAESTNSPEMQRNGWQSILNNFRKYAELKDSILQDKMKNQFTICLWFDNQAEEAANFYTSVFADSKIESVSRYGKEGFEFHGQKEGTVMTIGFQINGQSFIALNGGPVFKFTEAISLQVFCETQEEIDYYWSKLTEGGEEIQCGWLKDRFGLSWQIIPSVLQKLLSDPAKADRVTNAYLQMKKFDIQKLLTVR